MACSSEEGDVLHGVVAAVAGPELQLVDCGGGGDQSIAEFNMMAFGELLKITAGAPAQGGVYRQAFNCHKKSIEDGVLFGPSAMPEFRDGNGRAE